MGEGKAKYPPPTPRLPYDAYTPPVGHFITPHRCPHCENIPANIFPLPVTDPDPLPHYDDLFPPGYTPFPSPNTHLYPSFNTLPNKLPPTHSFPLDPPPSYDSLFATAAPPDSAMAPPNLPDYWHNLYLWDTDAESDWDL